MYAKASIPSHMAMTSSKPLGDDPRSPQVMTLRFTKQRNPQRMTRGYNPHPKPQFTPYSIEKSVQIMPI